MRLRSYRNYTNVLPEEAAEYRDEMLSAAFPKLISKHGRFFDFVRNSRSVQSTIVHFQVSVKIVLISVTLVPICGGTHYPPPFPVNPDIPYL